MQVCSHAPFRASKRGSGRLVIRVPYAALHRCTFPLLQSIKAAALIGLLFVVGASAQPFLPGTGFLPGGEPRSVLDSAPKKTSDF